eukprot:3136836-Pyramimonas_sp.AAC.1
MQGPRAVATRTLATYAGCATKGFPAGCSFATCNVQMYVVPPMDSWVPRFPTVDPSIFIDDFMLGSSNT